MTVLKHWIEIDHRYGASHHNLIIEKALVNGDDRPVINHYWVPVDVYDGVTMEISYSAYTDGDVQLAWHGRHTIFELVRRFGLEEVVASHGITLNELNPNIPFDDVDDPAILCLPDEPPHDEFYDRLTSGDINDENNEDLNRHLHEAVQHFEDVGNNSVVDESSSLGKVPESSKEPFPLAEEDPFDKPKYNTPLGIANMQSFEEIIDEENDFDEDKDVGYDYFCFDGFDDEDDDDFDEHGGES